MHYSRPYLGFIRNAFLKMLAYRLRYYTGIVTYLLLVSVYYFIWKAIFDNGEPGAAINGFTLNEMVSYIAIGWISRSFYFSNIDSDIEDLVRSGEISIYLIRPVNFQLMMFAQALGESLFRFCLFSIPISVVIMWCFPVSPPNTLLDLSLFCVATVVGFFTLVSLNFIVGLLSFSLKSIDGVIRAKQNIVQLASGLLLPIAFFPGWVQNILNVLPFKGVSYVPLNLYLGKIPHDQIWSTLRDQASWAIVLIIIGHLMWRGALTKLTVQGG